MSDLVDIFTENYKLLFRIIYAYSGNVEDTKDLLQDVFVRAYNASWSEIPDDKLLPWLIVIAKNTTKTYVTKNKPIITSDDNLLHASYEQDFLAFSVHDAISEMIVLIPQHLRKPLKAHLTDDIPLKKIAKQQGIPYSRLRYWKNQLASAVKPLIK